MDTLRPMGPGDVAAAQALTASFNWPHRVEDWAAMLALGDGLAAERDRQLVGTCVCWRFGNEAGTLGLIAVAAALHGQGLGRRMLHATLDGLAGRRLALHATEAGLALYRSVGFERAGGVVQHRGIAAPPEPQPLPAGTRLRPAAAADLPAVVALDRAACGMDRIGLLTALMALPGGLVLDRGGALAGFALVRRFGRGQLVGPVVAPDLAAAKALAGPLLAERAGQFVRMDVPQDAGLGPWLAEVGLAEAGTVVRMVRGDGWVLPPGPHVFGLASQAFG